jgi:hypothetical protein
MRTYWLSVLGLMAATALAVPAVADTYSENFSKTVDIGQHLEIGNSWVKPGHYQVTVNGNEVSLERHGKIVAQTTGTLEWAPYKYQETQVVFGPNRNVTEIRFGGRHEDLILSSAATAAWTVPQALVEPEAAVIVPASGATMLPETAAPTAPACQPAAFSQALRLNEQVQLDGQPLMPGRYMVTITGNDVTLEHDGNLVAHTTGTLDYLPQIYNNSEVVLGPRGNIRQIIFAGSHEDLFVN